MKPAACTPSDTRVLTAIADYIDANGYPPSLREIGATVGMSSTATVRYHIVRLAALGYLSHVPNRPRTIRLIRPEAS